MVLTSTMNTYKSNTVRPLPLKNRGTPRLPRVGMINMPTVCPMPEQSPSSSPVQIKFPKLKTSKSVNMTDSETESGSSSPRGKVLFQSAAKLLACYMRMSKLWVEQHFQKRECIRFIPTRETGRCGCGGMLNNHPASATQGLYRAHSVHSQTSSQASTDEHWSPTKHTASSPTDAFGTIEFQGSAHPLKAQYVRLSFDTKPELLLQLLTREWQLELPKLLITVHGGKANFELQPKLKAVLRQGLVKAAKTTGAWIFTAGTNTGVMRHVGEALVNERTPRLRGRVLAIGIAPWGIIDNRSDLIGKNEIPKERCFVYFKICGIHA